MPQNSLLPSDPVDAALRLTLIDNAYQLHDSWTIYVDVRSLDGDWSTLTAVHLSGRGSDYLTTTVEDLVHAFQYEDRRAIVREAQRDQRLAAKHARHYDRLGE